VSSGLLRASNTPASCVLKSGASKSARTAVAMVARRLLFFWALVLHAFPTCSPQARVGEHGAAGRTHVSLGSSTSTRVPTLHLRRAPAHSVRGTVTLDGPVQSSEPGMHRLSLLLSLFLSCLVSCPFVASLDRLPHAVLPTWGTCVGAQTTCDAACCAAMEPAA
jgi:hypothetical protein